MLNKYQITWVELRATRGIVTKKDVKVLGECFQFNGRAYAHFASKEKAMEYASSIKNKNVSKKYELRYFSDAQFERADTLRGKDGIGFNIEFTEKQNEEVITIG